ncbi:MAG: 6-phosphofructokinase [Deltaproteobacteria bacterium]|nr:6-phosphofructokinase [Deltaproteobacteria bacterium]
MTQQKNGENVKRVGIIFAGGPAPGANAVISSAVISFLDKGREVIGFYNGYEHLQKYDPFGYRLQCDKHYRVFTPADVSGLRGARGIVIGTSRANPGKLIHERSDLNDKTKSDSLQRVYFALVDHGIDALVSIGGDDTLKTANFLHEFQKLLPAGAHRVKIIHLPKTIDNDYRGIDFTFGYFTAVDFLAKEVRNLRADAAATNGYFIAETMGRKAGWLTYGVGIAGEANMIVSVEDVDETMMVREEIVDPVTGEKRIEQRLSLNALVDRIIRLIRTRAVKEGKRFGVIVLAEGLVEMLPEQMIRDITKDEHGHIGLGKMNLGQMVAHRVSARHKELYGQPVKCTGLQLGYEARGASPHAFDIMLGSQLGIGAYRALVEEGLDGFMVSVSGQLDLTYVPFAQLIDEVTMKTVVRFIQRDSDFFKLARFLESRTEKIDQLPGQS